MLLKSCTFHNFGPFADFKLDLESLGPDAKLVALVAPNGAGKTFCVETAMAGACYREMPTNGTLVKRATARDSWVESRVHFGKGLKIKHLVDAVSGKSEAVVTTDDNQPLLPTTSVLKFDAWAKKHLPDPDVFFSSIFAAQKSEGFVQMGSAERIDVILRVIGVARLERMAVAARKRQAAASAALEALETRIKDARGDAPTVAETERALTAAKAAAAAADEALESARIGLDLAIDDARAAEAKASEYAAALAKRSEIVSAMAAQREAVAKLEARIRNNRAVLAEREAIQDARAELEALADLDKALALDLAAASTPFDTEAAGLAVELAAQSQAVARAEAGARIAKARLDASKAAVAAASARVARARDRLTDEPRVTSAATKLEAARELSARARAAVEAAETALAELRGRTLAGATDRIGALRKGLTDISAMETETDDVRALGVVADNAIDADDQAARDAVEVPARIKELEQQHYSARVDLAGAERALAVLEALAAREPEMASARTELAAAINAAAAADRDFDGAVDAHADADADLATERATADAITARQVAAAERRAELEPPALAAIEANQRAAVARRAELAPVAAKHEHLVAADARLAELEPQLEAASAELARLESQESATPAPPPPTAAPDVAAYRERADEAERLARSTHGAAAVAEQQLTTARAVDARLASLEAERSQLEADLADWTRLSLDLGRSGLQSAEVDSAGPELTELVNDLLRNCHGPRFTVSVDTQRVDATGHKLVDECRIQVIDSVRGTDKEIREHSGGERALLGEAVSLALTMLACRRAGFERPTLIRDESASACDAANARAWVSMCRRAIEFTGADRMVFVSHSDEVVAMADAVIEIPSFGEAASA